MPQASVIVPARNAERTLPRTLAALAGQPLEGGYEVIVVDDGSTDATARIAREARPPVSLLRQERSGPAAARNRGARAARGSALAFCDADCFPTSGWLAAGVGALRSAELVQGHVLPDPDAGLGPFDRSLWITSEVGLYETANLFVTREVFESVGGFEDWLAPDVGKAMAEDLWFGWRARRLGARSAFCPEALAYHAVFERGPLGYIAERRRLRHFPEIARKVPELRDWLFYRRRFLTKRSAAFDALVVGLAVAAAMRSPLPLACGAPYARLARRRARGFGRSAPLVAAIDVVADALSAVELTRGSVRARSLLL